MAAQTLNTIEYRETSRRPRVGSPEMPQDSLDISTAEGDAMASVIQDIYIYTSIHIYTHAILGGWGVIYCNFYWGVR